MKSTLLIASLAALAALAPAQERVVNGGFETGDFTGWTRQSDFFLGVGEPGHESTYSAQYSSLHSGNYQILSQTLSTVTGPTYTFSLWTFDTAREGMEFESLQIKWDGTTLFEGYEPYQQWGQLSYSVQASGSSTEISVAAYSQAATYVDDVSVTPVPEPASLLSFGALIAIVLRKRRRRIAGRGV